MSLVFLLLFLQHEFCFSNTNLPLVPFHSASNTTMFFFFIAVTILFYFIKLCYCTIPKKCYFFMKCTLPFPVLFYPHRFVQSLSPHPHTHTHTFLSHIPISSSVHTPFFTLYTPSLTCYLRSSHDPQSLTPGIRSQGPV